MFDVIFDINLFQTSCLLIFILKITQILLQHKIIHFGKTNVLTQHIRIGIFKVEFIIDSFNQFTLICILVHREKFRYNPSEVKTFA